MFGKPRARTPSALKLIPRVVHFDYETAMRQNKYWHGDDPVVTHFFNALQAMFPEGERFFMESARDVRDELGKDNIPAELNEQIKLFIRQEAMHGREHDAWTTALISLGYIGMEGFDLKLKRDNKWSRKHLKPLWRLSMTAASEHFTASLAHLFIYKRPDLIEKAASPFRELLVYHAMEEVEHKAVCYDLYKEAKGGYFLRIFGMVFVTIDLLVRLRNRQEYLLKKDGLWTPAIQKKMRDLLWGRDGIMRVLSPYLLQYFRPDFHPWETDERRDLLEKFRAELQVVDAQQAQVSAA
ncbi:MAG TPA: metal-dependent hydrolase [Dongiaceae bacterium]|nr:metal-dependent hydrolase [Dongiaceae bacterium]